MVHLELEVYSFYYINQLIAILIYVSVTETHKKMKEIDQNMFISLIGNESDDFPTGKRYRKARDKLYEPL